MLTSGNHQYLRPEYLTPLPTTLDAKNSPLALLAQTCSAIGSDSPNPKLLANIEKSQKSHKTSVDSRDKLSPNSNQSSLSTGSNDNTHHTQMQQPQQQQHQQIKTSFKPYEPSPLNLHDRSNHTPTGSSSNHTIDLQERSSSNLGANHSNSSLGNNQSIRVKTPKSQQQQQNTQYNGHHLTQQHQQQQQRCDSNQSATSQTRDTSPAIVNGCTPNSSRTPLGSSSNQSMQQLHHNSSSPHHLQRTTSKDSSNNSLPRDSPNPNRLPNDMSKETLSASSAATNLAAAAAAAANNQQQRESDRAAAVAAATAASGSKLGSSSSMPGSYFPPGYHPSLSNYPMDLMTASAMMSPHHPMFKAAALSPYFNYARLKGASDPSSSAAAAAAAAAGMMPVCRDPYCTGCPMSPHVINKASGQPCPAGCTQCDSASASVAAAAAAASKSYQSHSNAAAAYAHAQLAALAAASQLPYVCSWIAGDSAYCGKRFGTSDELFQHLRTHTASMSESMLNAVAATGLPPNHPLFQRTYPTPPLSPLSSARYHPYGKPSMLPPSLGPPSLAASLSAAGMHPSHPSLAQYFSPYSLYGPRLGASPSMHP